MNYTILQGDNRETLKTLQDNSIDAIVTDPPYGIDFLGKSWDANTGALETYQECLRVLKPGGHILAFSAARTYHHLAITLEQAGFEIRDQLMWIHSYKMPKGNNLKPGHEPIALAAKSKPNKLNIDQCRISRGTQRYPANGVERMAFNEKTTPQWQGNYTVNDLGGYPHNVITDLPEYEKYYYTPRVSKKEKGMINNHPTVKPVALMRWLIKLITPANGVVLDPFCGSGSTGMAAVELGHTFIGCELDPNYAKIAETRIRNWNETEHATTNHSKQHQQIQSGSSRQKIWQDLFEYEGNLLQSKNPQ